MTSPHRQIGPPQGDLFTPQQPYIPQQLSHLFRPGHLPPQPGSVPQQRPPAPPRQPYPITHYRLEPQPRTPRRKSLAWLVVAAVAVAMLLVAGVAVGVVKTRSAASATSATSAASTSQAEPAPQTVSAPVLVAHRAVTAREWLLIAKDPEAHKGDRVIVYGQVKQLDAATGSTQFRANVDGVTHSIAYGYADYETNTVLAGAEADLRNVVQGDLFVAHVTVLGAISYDTQIGGQTTAPALAVDAIQITGAAK